MYLRLKTFLLLGSLLLLAACATGPRLITDRIADTEIQFARGDYAGAARSFYELARQASGAQRTELLLRASAAFARAGNLHQARQVLKTVQPDLRDPAQQLLLRLSEAHIALMERRPEDVLSILRNPPAATVKSAWRADYHDLRADAYSMLGNRLETAHELVKRETFLRDPELVQANQQDIWQALSMLSERALQQLRTAPPPDVLSGWMELVQITKAYQLHPASLREAVTRWQQRYPGHPAQAALLTDLLTRRVEDILVPKQIALLLPLSGKYARAGEAVRDGVIAAYYTRDSGAAQTLRVYDSAAADIAVLYKQAINDGAEFVIGPLDKSRIEQLIHTDDLPVPTLALNYVDSEDIPARLFQFGLSPEEEARQVAERTWLDGYVNAAALIPEGPWGERVFGAFASRWQEIGGKVVERQNYNASRNDYSTSIRMLLNLDDSRRRYRSLVNLLNQTIKYTPRRRQDIDFIFLAAYPRQARQIRPQLKFYHAADVPVYATSHVFTGNLNPERDRDMDGLIFGDMPWVLVGSSTHRGLRAEVEPYISRAGNRLQRLYALGIDSYKIIAALSPLKKYPYQRYDGETGSLGLDAKQRIQRQLTWVRFRSGRPVALDEASP
ncbi:MAG: penicillin-binding protein activator [Alphaproteobacteria bacterium]